MPKFEVQFIGTVYIDAEDAEQAQFFAEEDLATVAAVSDITKVIELNGI